MIVKTFVFPYDEPTTVIVHTDCIKPDHLRRFKDSKKRLFRHYYPCPRISFITFEEESDYDEV